MIKKLIQKLLGQSPSASPKAGGKSTLGQRAEIGPRQHGIDPDAVDARAIEVVRGLQEAGFEAYIVGGAVRDLLLGLRPKDFDVATNATPEEVKRLFRRAFIIGRRFRIVHVVFGRGREHEVIEVSTFRAYLDHADAHQVQGSEQNSQRQLADSHHAVHASGRVLRDNVWGPQIEDAARRDFTINAMYYDPQTQTVVDYHEGLRDAKKRVLRLIGDAATRYREDPVRILRGVRFAAKLSSLGFSFEAKTARPLAAMKHLLGDVPPSRLFDEMLKLLQTGHALASIEQLKKLGLDQGIDPLLDLVVARGQQALVRAALQDTDARVQMGKGVSPSFLLACVLWQDVRERWQKLLQSGQHNSPALHQAIDEVFAERVGEVSGRGKLAADMREIWSMQPRFERRVARVAENLVLHLRFRAAYDFLRLRADVGEVPLEWADWWQEYAQANETARADLLRQARPDSAPRKTRVPRSSAGAEPGTTTRPTRKETSAATSSTTPTFDLPPGAEMENPDAPAKKRRRRRRPSGASGGASGAPDTSGTDLK